MDRGWMWLRLLAPWVSVGVFWLWLENGWLAILAYHAQILLWMRVDAAGGERAQRTQRVRGMWHWIMLVMGTAVLAASVMVIGRWLLPLMTHTAPQDWLARFGLLGSYPLMVVYLGLVHPWLEQRHWRPLTQASAAAHLWFAGYHVLVLISLLSWPWVVVGFCTLTVVSVGWSRLARWTQSRLYGTLSHVGADLGLALGLWWLLG